MLAGAQWQAPENELVSVKGWNSFWSEDLCKEWIERERVRLC